MYTSGIMEQLVGWWSGLEGYNFNYTAFPYGLLSETVELKRRGGEGEDYPRLNSDECIFQD
jgi:hypothetical protein